MKKKYIILIFGVVLVGVGWAIRSTFIFPNYINKPIGGSLIVVGALGVSAAILLLLKKTK